MPPKAAARAMQRNPMLRFDHWLALKLGKTAGQIRALPNSEYLSWIAYFQLEQQDQQLAAIKAKQLQQARGRR